MSEFACGPRLVVFEFLAIQTTPLHVIVVVTRRLVRFIIRFFFLLPRTDEYDYIRIYFVNRHVQLINRGYNDTAKIVLLRLCNQLAQNRRICRSISNPGRLLYSHYSHKSVGGKGGTMW